MDLTDVTAILSAASTAMATWQIMPFILSGAVVYVAGRILLSAKKGAR